MPVISFMEELWGRRVCEENFSEAWTEPRVSLLQNSVEWHCFWQLHHTPTLTPQSLGVTASQSYVPAWSCHRSSRKQCLDTKRSTNHPPPREEDVCFILFVPMVFLSSDFLGYCTVFIPCFYLWTNRIASLDGEGVCSAGTSAGSHLLSEAAMYGTGALDSSQGDARGTTGMQ